MTRYTFICVRTMTNMGYDQQPTLPTRAVATIGHTHNWADYYLDQSA